MLSVNLNQVHRLVTHEDARFGHVHKIIGFATLGHYAYRWWRWTVDDGDMGFRADWATLAWILLHASLHVSSFQFHLSTKRNRVYNIIWPEMRWHAMIFAYRSFVTMVAVWLAEAAPTMLVRSNMHLIRPAIVLGTMACADVATAHYGSTEQTMRGNPYPEGTPAFVIQMLNCFYSLSQAGATLRILSTSDMGTAFTVALPIQLAPFLMTLVKKGLITQGGWHFWYAASLVSAYVYSSVSPRGPSVMDVEHTIAYLAAFALARFVFRMNKYLIWTVFSIGVASDMRRF